jgi:hypothetical protein
MLNMFHFLQVSSESLYLTDDSNRAVFIDANGLFSVSQLSIANHYEVHGDAITMEDVTRSSSASSEPNTSSASSSLSFAFAQRQSPGPSTSGAVQFRKQIAKRVSEVSIAIVLTVML